MLIFETPSAQPIQDDLIALEQKFLDACLYGKWVRGPRVKQQLIEVFA